VVRFPAWSGDCSVLHIVHSSSGIHTALHWVFAGSRLSVDKAGGRWIWPFTSF